MNKEAARLIRKLGLEKHPEGGYFKQTYKSDTAVDFEGYDGPRSISSAVYYMLVGHQFSAFHKLKSDEIWHHYAGGSITLYTINSDGKLSKIKIGRGGAPQAVIKADTWFAASLDSKKSYCLLGCTMSPGFEYRDWTLGKRVELLGNYPRDRRIICRYTK